MREARPRRRAVVDEGVIEGARRLGASEQELADLQAQADAERAQAQALDVFEVHADNWDDWLFFLSVQTQWVYASTGMGSQRTGLHYPGVESAARLQGLPRRLWPQRFEAVHAVELAVLAADAKQAQAGAAGR